MPTTFPAHFADRLKHLDAAEAAAMGQRVAAFHRSAPPDAKMPYPLYFEFLLAMSHQALRKGEEVVVLLDGVSIRRPGHEPLALPFCVESPAFAEYCRHAGLATA